MNAHPPFEGERTKVRKLRFTLFADVDPAPRKIYLVSAFLGAGEMSCIYAGPGSAKSLLATDLGFHVAAGREWFGRRVTRQGVLYVAAERSKLVERRLAALRKHHGVDDLPFAVVSGMVDLRTGDVHADEIAGYARDLRELYSLDVGLIIVDTVSRVMAGGDENAPKDMGALVGTLTGIMEATQAHVLLIHHTPQDNNRMRGHGALLGAVDTSISIERNGDQRTATIVKDNDGGEGQAVTFGIEGVSLSIDRDTGEETSAPVIRHLDAVATLPKREKKAAIKGDPAIALSALHECIGEIGIVPPVNEHIPTGVKAVTGDQWKEHALKRGMAEDAKPASQEQAMRRAKIKLLEVHRIGIWEPYVWAV